MKTALSAKRMQQRADQFLNPLKERELHLRGEMIETRLFMLGSVADVFFLHFTAFNYGRESHSEILARILTRLRRF